MVRIKNSQAQQPGTCIEKERSPLRVCHLVSGDVWAGAEAVVWNLLSAQAKQANLEVSVIIMNEGRLEKLLREAGIPTWLISESEHTPWDLLRAVEQALKEITPTIVHSHRYKENLLSYFLAWRHGASSVVTLHGHTEKFRDPFVRAKFLFLRAFAYRIAWLVDAYFIAVSEDMRTLHRRPPQRCIVIPNGIPIPDESPRIKAAANQTKNRAPVIGWVGRMVPVKGVTVLLDAIAQMPPGPRQPSLLLVGDGPERSALKSRAQLLGIAERVRFVGFVTDPHSYIAHMDLFALPSLHEGTPIALLEAMGAGVPVVAAAVGGIPEIIKDGEAGCLVNSHSPSAWASTLTELVNDPGRARTIAERGRRLVQKQYSVEVMAARYIEVYRNRCAKKRETLCDGKI